MEILAAAVFFGVAGYVAGRLGIGSKK